MGNVPVCPVHNVEMRPGKKGGYYCSKKQDNGEWCDWGAKNDGNVYQKKDSAGYSPKPTQNTGSGRAGVDWDKLGKVKALCGMANAMISAGKDPLEVVAALPKLESLLGAIESKAGLPIRPPQTGRDTIEINEGDIPF